MKLITHEITPRIDNNKNGKLLIQTKYNPIMTLQTINFDINDCLTRFIRGVKLLNSNIVNNYPVCLVVDV